MKICLMCDLHLPSNRNALQYRVLDWAIEDICRKEPDCILYAGDATCDGDISTYQYFIEKMIRLDIPFIYIPGNSDLRCIESREDIYKTASCCKNTVGEISVFAVNDSDGKIPDEAFNIIESADHNDIVFMHHPLYVFSDEDRRKFIDWRKRHKDTVLFYGHLHKSASDDGITVSLQAMDPDKAIGECPCITYYETETRALRKAYYFAPVPLDFHDYLGVSCYSTLEHIDLAIDNGLHAIELRTSCIKTDWDLLEKSVKKWRENGGKDLSIHFPDVEYRNGDMRTNAIDQFVELVNRLKIDRITQHVPRVSVAEVKKDSGVLDVICDYLAEKFNTIDHPVVIGVENMHMTSQDTPNDSRRFGYIPEECLQFMRTLSLRCAHKVGINFDFGHARNNIPYSQKYQISTWLSQIGPYAVGYHIHQVIRGHGAFDNHTAITDVYGGLISYASFFKCWSDGTANKAPVIMEMRQEGAYDISLQTFRRHRERNVFDIHTHTHYSFCGKDKPDTLIVKAIEQGISVLGICDHSYGIGQRKREYIQLLHDLAEKYKDSIKLLCGIEIATLPHKYDIKDARQIDGCDYCLIEHITDPKSIVGANLFQFCENLGIPCGIAHTDLFSYCDMYGYEYEDFFSKMAERNIFWEMNVSYDSVHHYREHAYVADFVADGQKIEIIKNAGVTVSIGSDCHRCEEYSGEPVYRMYDFLQSKGIRMFDSLI